MVWACSRGRRVRVVALGGVDHGGGIQWSCCPTFFLSRECPGQLYRRVVYDSYVTYLDFVKQGCKASDVDQYFQSLGAILDGALPPELDG